MVVWPLVVRGVAPCGPLVDACLRAGRARPRLAHGEPSLRRPGTRSGDPPGSGRAGVRRPRIRMAWRLRRPHLACRKAERCPAATPDMRSSAGTHAPAGPPYRLLRARGGRRVVWGRAEAYRRSPRRGGGDSHRQIAQCRVDVSIRTHLPRLARAEQQHLHRPSWAGDSRVAIGPAVDRDREGLSALRRNFRAHAERHRLPAVLVRPVRRERRTRRRNRVERARVGVRARFSSPGAQAAGNWARAPRRVAKARPSPAAELATFSGIHRNHLGTDLARDIALARAAADRARGDHGIADTHALAADEQNSHRSLSGGRSDVAMGGARDRHCLLIGRS